jgi:aldehyde:ferredoxin oxidoreductase
VTGPKTGFCCPFPAGGRRYEVRQGKYATIFGDEREGGFSLGAALVGVTSWSASLKIRDLCNKYALDEFQVIYTIAWAMECYEKGLITKEDTGGIKLRFGDEDAVVEMTEKIAFREGFGKILAEGSQEAAKRIGKGSEKFLLTIKGRELETMNQRAVYAIALALAVSEGGPDHTRWYPPYPPNPKMISKDIDIPFDIVQASIPRSVKDKGRFVKWLYDSRAVLESIPTCVFATRGSLKVDMKPWLDGYNACTGANYTMDEFLRVGERIVNLERAYMIREGFRRADDTIPRRMLEEPITDGHIPPVGENLNVMLDDYYTVRGWDIATSIPKEDKLRELGLDFVINDLKNLK